MLFNLRSPFCGLLLLGLPLTADAGSLSTMVESSLGDGIEITSIPVVPTAQNTIEACLLDATGGEAKGFDIRRDHPPRFVTHGPKPVCAELFAGAHQVVFWRASHGQLQPIASLPIDLTGHANERLWMIWRIDGAL